MEAVMVVHSPKLKIARVVKDFSLWMCFALIAGCTSSKPPELKTGYVFPGAGNTISLDGFWHNIENNLGPVTSTAPIEIDPMGGLVVLYWIDDKGNVCHGQPGVSGQPGPVTFRGFQQQALDTARAGTAITESQLLAFQKIPYNISLYISDTQASGSYFMQFGNVLWRIRADGKTFKDSMTSTLSVPLIISVDTTNTIFPMVADRSNPCLNGYATLPADKKVLTQHPDMCLTRALPNVNVMSYEESIKYCIVNLPHGLEMSRSWEQ